MSLGGIADTIAAERGGADLEALLEGDISREEFVERGRGHFETPGDD